MWQRRLPLIVGVSVAIVIGVLYAIACPILLKGFLRVEQQILTDDVRRVLDALHREVANIEATTQDYAAWDDTYAFIQNPDADYIQSKVEGTFAANRLNIAVFVDRTNHVVFGAGFDLSQGVQTPLPPSLQSQDQLELLFPSAVDLPNRYQGVVLLPEGPLLVAIHPIVTSKGKGPVQGHLLLGRYLNDAQIQYLADLTRVSLHFYPLNASPLPLPIEHLRALMTEPIFIMPLDQDWISGYALIKDIQAKPALLVRVTTPREVYQRGLVSIRYFGGSLLVLGLLFGSIIWFMLRRLFHYLAERDRIQQVLFQEKELAQVTLQSIGDGVITTDAKGEIQSLNPVAERLMGYEAVEVQGRPITEVFRVLDENTLEPAENLVAQTLERGQRHTLTTSSNLLIARDGKEYAIDESVAPICSREGEVVGVVLVFRDVTQARQRSHQLTQQARYDSLTGLINRREFERCLEDAILSARTQNQEHSLCFVDLDRFKQVNDTCGHSAGDELLRQIGTLLPQKVRKTDLVARLGGDEFGILLYQCSLEQALHLAQGLCDSVEEVRFCWQDQVFTIGASIGLVRVTTDSPNLMEVLDAADAACYIAKDQGRGQVHVHQVTDQEQAQQRGQKRWAIRVQQALEQNQFQLYAQQVIPLQERDRLRGYSEILLRLVDQGDLVTPGTFIPAAERSNLMPHLDRWVIQSLLGRLNECYGAKLKPAVCLCNLDHPLYSINLSSSTLNDGRFIPFLREQLAQVQVPPQTLCFEIAEGAAIANLGETVKLIHAIRDLGCRLALDNVGISLSSLHYLKMLPVHYLKISGELIENLEHDPVALAVVKAIHQIAQTLNMQTIAGCVTSASMQQRVTELGIDYAQGYAIAKPHPFGSEMQD